MSEYTKLFERAGARYEAPSLSREGLLRRRDRRRRNQRITAGVVGITVFMAAVWIVRDVASLNRTQTPVVPGGGGTGPTVTRPVIGPTGDPFSVKGFEGLPPEDATPSEPARAQPVVSDGGIHPWYSVNVYADGRLIWARSLQTNPGPTASVWIEQRLTPEGVEQLRSGAVELGGQFENPGEQLPVSAWEDPTLRPYVPSRYEACFTQRPQAMDLLPARAQDLLRGTARLDDGPGCVYAGGVEFDVTIEVARALAKILSDVGFEQVGTPLGGVMYTDPNEKREPNLEPLPLGIEFAPLLPDGNTAAPGG